MKSLSRHTQVTITKAKYYWYTYSYRVYSFSLSIACRQSKEYAPHDTLAQTMRGWPHICTGSRQYGHNCISAAQMPHAH